MSDGSLAQPKQARLSARFGGAPPLSTAGGTAVATGVAAAALAASLSAFSAFSASLTSLVPAPRSHMWRALLFNLSFARAFSAALSLRV
eukprot:scaffold121620_cov69-Phaeocystis_antarctica.AAC.3